MKRNYVWVIPVVIFFVMVITIAQIQSSYNANEKTVSTIVSSHTSETMHEKTTKQAISPASSKKLYPAGSREGIDSGAQEKAISTSTFAGLISAAYSHPRKRKMIDLTMDLEENSMQTLISKYVVSCLLVDISF